jgi:hypothetical protein
VSEVLLWLTDAYENTISQRIAYNETYQNYLKQKNSIKTLFYTQEEKEIRQIDIPDG